MKISNRLLLVIYIIATGLVSSYTLTSIENCEAFWMHDGSITISKEKVFLNILYLFLLPVLIILIQRVFKIKTQKRLFLTHFFVAVTSISLLLSITNQPCKYLNGGHYMFISFSMTLCYFFLKLVSFVIIGIIIIKTIRSKVFQRAITNFFETLIVIIL